MLWVEQGTGQDIDQAVEHAGDHLKSALNSLVSEVASSGGDELIESVRSRRDTLLTSTGKPRGDYLQLEKDRDQYQQDIEALKGRIRNYQDQVDRLQKLNHEYEQAEKERPWEDAQRQLDQAKARYQQVERLEQDQKQDEAALEQLLRHQRLLKQNKDHLENLTRQLEGRKSELDRAQREFEQTQANTAAIARGLVDAKSAYEAAENQLKLARLLETRTRLEEDIRRLEQQNRTLSQNLDKARDHQRQLDEARAEARANQIEASAVKALKRTEQQLNEETIRSQTIATRLSWQLEPGVSVTLNDAPLDKQERSYCWKTPGWPFRA